ncbi:MAG: hypothetical protein IKZ42_08755 [Clostridiales bacterium]|nr:hypothetical protein [Clostridiales bacterium]
MLIQSKDSERVIDIGSTDILFSLYSTIMIRLKKSHSELSEAISFFQTGECKCDNAIECARQINLIRDKLSQINPNDAIYDMNDLSKEAPWKGKMSRVVTSCGNMFTTSDGKDLLFEIVSILTYSYYHNVDVSIES